MVLVDYYGRNFEPKMFEEVFYVSDGRLTPCVIFGLEEENVVVLKSFNGIAVERVVSPEKLIVPSNNVPNHTRVIGE